MAGHIYITSKYFFQALRIIFYFTNSTDPDEMLLLSAYIFANRLNPDHARHNVVPDLDPNCLTLSAPERNFGK